jgi:uncharacterized protein YndB with AHSA1/START domain
VSAADRELRAETVVAAPPQVVWRVLADVRQMPRLSDELVRMVPLSGGGLRPGQTYLGINRRGAVVWPTRSVVAEVEPGRLLSWDTTSSGARWIWELEPLTDVDGEDATRVVHRRPVPRGLTRASGVFAGLLLGGAGGHADELETGMARSVGRLKELVESRPRGV